MPEIDKDLYQVLMLALSGIAVLLLLLLLSALGRMRKVLQEQLEETRSLASAGGIRGSEPGLLPSEPVDDRPPAIPTPEPAHYGIDDSDDRPLVGGAAAAGAVGIASAPADGGTRESSDATSEPDAFTEPAPWDRVDDGPGIDEPSPLATPEQDRISTPESFGGTEAAPEDPFAPAQGSGAEPEREAPIGTGTSGGDDPFATTGASEDQFATTGPAEGTASSDDPFAEASSSKSADPFLTGGEDENPFIRDADQPAPASTIDEPEEQPFERNGRWYFKREGELLVYEEGTGEWVAAEAAGSGGGGPRTWANTSEGTDTSADSGDAAPTDTAELDAVGDQGASRPASGGFWKCPSCGAVNGSSATSCRMCFSDRP